MRRWLDILIGIIAIIVPAGLLLADQVVSAVPPYGHIKIAPGLVGVTRLADPAPSMAGMLDGDWQAAFARMIGARTPLYPFAVRLKNQIMVSVFGTSGVPAIVLGRGGELLETEYLTEYCSRDLATFQRLAAAWAPKLRQMQDAYTRRGKTFLYVITPSKVAQNPELIPASYHCLARDADRTGLLPLWHQYLDTAGVHTVDVAAVMAAAKGHYPFSLFPRGGTHWNSVGAALATRAIAGALDGLRGDDLIPPPEIKWTMVPRPIWPDDDLAALMNLLAPDQAYAVPRAVLSFAAPGECRPLAVAIVGGSFMNRPAEYLAEGPCAPHVEEWQYWSVYDITWPPGVDFKSEVVPAERDPRLLSADIVLYEENEQVAARSTQGPAFYNFLRASWGIR